MLFSCKSFISIKFNCNSNKLSFLIIDVVKYFYYVNYFKLY